MHLQMFPWMRNGLSRTERKILKTAPGLSSRAGGRGHFMRIVGEVMVCEKQAGFGDGEIAWWLEGLSHGKSPALAIRWPAQGRHPGEPPERNHSGARVRLTPIGREIRDGRADWVRLNGIDRWVGGVHLQGEEADWRWDEERRRLVGR